MALTTLYLVLRRDDDGTDVLVGAIKQESELIGLIVERERPNFLKTVKCRCVGKEHMSHLHADDFEAHIRRVISKYRMEIAC
jgi:hypothetical protein